MVSCLRLFPWPSSFLFLKADAHLELAQSEAFYCQHGHEHTWVNNFLHMGHLSISGSKMSKSLKNFQTIKEALDSSSPLAYTARSMRIVFLLGRWNEGVEISPDMRTQAGTWESTVNKFFTNTKARLTEANGSANTIQDSIQNLSVSDKQSSSGLLAELEQAQKDYKASLSNSLDTPQAMRVISEIIRKVNIHIREAGADLDLRAIEEIARWITKMVGILGLDANATPPYEGLGWTSVEDATMGDPRTEVEPYKKVYDTVISDVKALKLPASDSITNLLSQTPEAEFESLVSSGSLGKQTLALPYLRAISKLRDELRRIAPTSGEAKGAILRLSDEIRDTYLYSVRVWLDDLSDGLPSLIKFLSEDEIKAREKLEEQAKQKAEQKAQKQQEQLKKEQERLRKAKIDPRDLFKGNENYIEWDDDGIPTKMKDGSDITKSQNKKLKKEQDAHKKVHERYLAEVAATAKV